MSIANLQFPVLVQPIAQEGKRHYLIRPLFFYRPVVLKRRYEEAMTAFYKGIREHFKGFQLDQSNSSSLLWFHFNPKVKLLRISLNESLGRHPIKGDFHAAFFTLQDKTFVCLPDFGSYLFLSPHRPAQRKAFQEEIREQLRFLLRQRLELEEDIADCFAAPNSFLSEARLSISIQHAPFSFENSGQSWFFAQIHGESDFDGGIELERVGFDYNERYPSDLQRAPFREKEAQRLQQLLYQAENTPVVLLGPEGVGKHSLLEECVFRYLQTQEKAHAPYEHTQKVWQMDPNRLIAGMSIVGMWQKRLEAIIEHLRNRLKQWKIPGDKLVIDKVVALLHIGKSAQNSMSLSDVLRPYLEKRQLQIILVATPEEWKILQEKNRRFADLFQVLRLQEPDTQTAVRMLLEKRKELEYRHHGQISIQALEKLFTLHRNYFGNRALPGSVASMLSQLAVKHRYHEVDVNEVELEFRQLSGLNPHVADSEQYSFEPQQVEKELGSQIIGQPAVVEALAQLIHLIKAKLNDPSKPLGSFLFIGPTGVGKTQAAKVLAEYLLGDAKRLLRFDMNEYIDEYGIFRLIGDTQQPDGLLTGKVRQNPFGIVLLDEIEKAHPKIHDLLLQVLDDGRLTDALGRTVDFSNTIIIMTSNVGAERAGNQLGFRTGGQLEEAIYFKAVEQHFRPEFVNRIDRMVAFRPLELEHILHIAQLQIKELLQRDGFVRRTTILNISKEALEWVARRGFDARMGGRALKRQIERDLTALSAEQLLQSQSDAPILFDIHLQEEQLQPNIQTLRFAEPLEVDWMPDLPNDQEAKRYYGQLLRQLEQMEKRIKAQQDQGEQNEDLALVNYDSGDASDWHFYDYQDLLLDTKEQIKRILLGFGSRFFRDLDGKTLRLKSVGTASIIFRNNAGGHERNLMEDKLFQESALEELRHVYQHAPDQFNSNDSAFIRLFLAVERLKKALPDVLSEQVSKVRLSLQPLAGGGEESELDYLKERYLQVLDYMGVPCNHEDYVLHFEGYGFFDLFKSEHGLHFFHRAHQTPIPIRVEVESPDDLPLPQEPKVLRMYDIWLGADSKNSTITDLRTGYSNYASIRPEEFLLLLYAGSLES